MKEADSPKVIPEKKHHDEEDKKGDLGSKGTKEEKGEKEEKVRKAGGGLLHEKLPDDVAQAVAADPQRDTAPTEALQSLLDTLTTQRAQLRARKAKEEAHRSRQKAREELRAAVRAAAAKRGEGQPWRRPRVSPEELSKPGTITSIFLPPYQQQAVDRPAKTYEKVQALVRVPGTSHTQWEQYKIPFLETSPYSYMFGDPPPHELSARQRKAKALADAAKLSMKQSGSRSARAEVHTGSKGASGDGTTVIGPAMCPCGSPPSLLHKQTGFLTDRLDHAVTGKIPPARR